MTKKAYILTSQTVIIKGGVRTFLCIHQGLTALDASKNTKLEDLYCPESQLTYETLNLPYVSDGTLWFKNTDKGDTQKLTPAQVEAIKAKGWKVFNQKNHYHYEYPGE